jgi:predicted ArsR family transcriptional regulator|uniref:helix-turn-helix transcriptional regulator n=1 Tax=Prosthecobacter sp. TaxID=1965333 RepID=UPI0037836AE8
MLHLLREMLHTPVLDILHHLKHSTGLPVRELSTRMKMSYMGVKQHCVDLEKAGFLDTWRRSKGAGRPEKIYRLTPKVDALFDGGFGLALTLEILTTAERVYGETAPPKLLYTYFQAKAEALAPKLAKAVNVAERAKLLAKLRSADGCLSTCETDENGHLCLVEHHRPLRALAAHYDMVDELECEMIERLLGCEVRRSVEEVSGLVRVTFRIKTSAHHE